MSLVSYALTTVDRQKNYMGISSLTATQTTVMENLINMATNMIESYCGRRFMETTYTEEVYDGPRSERILLNNYPVNTREDFKLERNDSSANEDAWNELNDTDYFVYYDEGVVNLTGRSNFILYTRKYRVTYTAGYDFDNAATFLAETEAGDVEMACWMMVSQWWLTRKSIPGTTSERLGDYSFTLGSAGSMSGFFRDGAGPVSTVEMILNKYRRTEPESYLTVPDVGVSTDEED